VLPWKTFNIPQSSARAYFLESFWTQESIGSKMKNGDKLSSCGAVDWCIQNELVRCWHAQRQFLLFNSILLLHGRRHCPTRVTLIRVWRFNCTMSADFAIYPLVGKLLDPVHRPESCNSRCGRLLMFIDCPPWPLHFRFTDRGPGKSSLCCPWLIWSDARQVDKLTRQIIRMLRPVV
jgi:hypothetical protein